MTKTTARRKKGEAGAAAAAGAALAAVAFSSWPDAKGVVFWTGSIGLGLLVGAAVGFREADCPSCGRAQNFSPGAGYVRCRHCRRYARARPDGLEDVAEDFVAPAPVFGIPLKEDSVLPRECCVCRAPATRTALLAVKLDDGRPYKTLGEGLRKSAALGAGLRPALEVRLDVPHCAIHDADARVDMDRPPEGLFDAGSSAELVLRVRSYPYYRAALGL